MIDFGTALSGFVIGVAVGCGLTLWFAHEYVLSLRKRWKDAIRLIERMDDGKPRFPFRDRDAVSRVLNRHPDTLRLLKDAQRRKEERAA